MIKPLFEDVDGRTTCEKYISFYFESNFRLMQHTLVNSSKQVAKAATRARTESLSTHVFAYKESSIINLY